MSLYARGMEWGEERRYSKRGEVALLLCLLSKGIARVLAGLSGIGVIVAIIVLAINGTISIVAAILLPIVAVPVVGTLAYWLALAIGFPLLGIAKLLDRDVVSEWLDSQPVDDY